MFSVGIELALTESMHYCDIKALPAASNFEHADLIPRMAISLAAACRAGDCADRRGALPNTEIFRRLAARFGFDEPCFKATDAELMDDAVDAADRRLRGCDRAKYRPTRRCR